MSEGSSPGGARIALLVRFRGKGSVESRRDDSWTTGAVRELADTLRDPAHGSSDVKILLDVSPIELPGKLEEVLSDRSSNDVVFLYLYCQGQIDENGALLLAAAGTGVALAPDSVRLSVIVDLAKRTQQGRVVLLIDCGHTFITGEEDASTEESAGQTVPSSLARLEVDDRVFGVIASAGVGPLPESGGQAPAPAALLAITIAEGIHSGWADKDGDGSVTLDEMYAYAAEKLSVLRWGQRVGIWRFGAPQSDLLMSHTARRPIASSELPPNVSTLVGGRWFRPRLKAVRQLKRMIASNTLGEAVAARSALQALAEDDHRRVAKAAMHALDATSLRARPPRVDFGPVAVGREPAQAKFRLDGSPLALNAAVEPTDISVRCKINGPDLAVFWFPRETGKFATNVRVSGPLGTASISITGTATGAADESRPEGRQARSEESASQSDDGPTHVGVGGPASSRRVVVAAVLSDNFDFLLATWRKEAARIVFSTTAVLLLVGLSVTVTSMGAGDGSAYKEILANLPVPVQASCRPVGAGDGDYIRAAAYCAQDGYYTLFSSTPIASGAGLLGYGVSGSCANAPPPDVLIVEAWSNGEQSGFTKCYNSVQKRYYGVAWSIDKINLQAEFYSPAGNITPDDYRLLLSHALSIRDGINRP